MDIIIRKSLAGDYWVAFHPFGRGVICRGETRKDVVNVLAFMLRSPITGEIEQ